MTSLQFEGDLSGLSERQVEFIREVIEKQGYENNKVVFEPVGKKGDNYTADVKRITVAVNGDNDFKMIVKIAPQHEITRQSQNAPLVFSNEITMYEKVLPKFTSLEKSIEVPVHERYKYPKCYGSLLEESNELILLEDLNVSDYAMLDRFVPLEDDAVRLTLKNLSILHSLSFVLKHLEPETFDDYKSCFFDLWHLPVQVDKMKHIIKQIEDVALSVLDDDHHKKAVRGTVSEYFNILKRSQKYDNDKHLIIQQGDPWTNNIIFKKENGKLVDAVMIDYQLSKVSNPVCDLHYMIFNCTDYESRSKNYHKWIDYYHEELDRSLSNFGLKASLIYPRDQLDIDLKRYSKSFFCISVWLSSILTRNEAEAAMVRDAMKSDNLETITDNYIFSKAYLSSNTVELLKKRIIDLIHSYRELGYIA